jgi:DNA-binding MarR family transcriptional regulator
MTRRAPRRSSFEDVPLSALIRAARRPYGMAVRRAQEAIGCDDLPRAGGFILTTMSWSDASVESVVQWMGVSKQAVSQVLDRLVVRGYLERKQDLRDRRRVRLVLTERGRAAAAAARTAIEAVDRQLVTRVGRPRITQTRATLEALIEIGRARGRRAPDVEGGV